MAIYSIKQEQFKMNDKLKNQTASALHLMTAGLAMLKGGITSIDALRLEATELGAGKDVLDRVDADLVALAKRVDAAEKAKLALHERITRELDGTVLKIGT